MWRGGDDTEHRYERVGVDPVDGVRRLFAASRDRDRVLGVVVVQPLGDNFKQLKFYDCQQ